jgi:hypothetical protein
LQQCNPSNIQRGKNSEGNEIIINTKVATDSFKLSGPSSMLCPSLPPLAHLNLQLYDVRPSISRLSYGYVLLFIHILVTVVAQWVTAVALWVTVVAQWAKAPGICTSYVSGSISLIPFSTNAFYIRIYGAATLR